MKFRTNQERRKRKFRKANEAISAAKKQLHINFHRKLTYHDIIQQIKTKISHIIIQNKSVKHNKSKVIMPGKLLWARGTYIKKLHGEFKRN